MTRLVAAEDRHFAWLLGEADGDGEFRIAPGGVEDVAVLVIVRALAAALHRDGCRAHWMIVHGDEVVGLCGFKRAPLAGEAEIGYGIAASRRGRSHATAAVALILAAAPGFGVSVLTAETTVSNRASAIVLERNGFGRIGQRDDPHDGALVLWARRI